MDIDGANAERTRLNDLLAEQDDFFAEFGRLDDEVYADGAIPKRYKELVGIAISVVSSCEECVRYHVQGALDAGATTEQIVEAIRLGVIGGGSVTYPTARYAVSVLEELGALDESGE
jgi:AhpD family alkylhydroperoxidase